MAKDKIVFLYLHVEKTSLIRKHTIDKLSFIYHFQVPFHFLYFHLFLYVIYLITFFSLYKFLRTFLYV